MTEYEILKEEIIATALLYTGDAKALTTRLMTIIAKRCVFLDKNQDLPEIEELHNVKAMANQPFIVGQRRMRTRMHQLGWRPVIEIKKEGKGV